MNWSLPVSFAIIINMWCTICSMNDICCAVKKYSKWNLTWHFYWKLKRGSWINSLQSYIMPSSFKMILLCVSTSVWTTIGISYIRILLYSPLGNSLYYRMQTSLIPRTLWVQYPVKVVAICINLFQFTANLWFTICGLFPLMDMREHFLT